MALLVAAFVVVHLAGESFVAGNEGFADLDDGLFVVAGPRFFSAQRGDAVGHGRAVGVLALVGVDLGQVDLRERTELGSDLGGRQFVVVVDREVVVELVSELAENLGCSISGGVTASEVATAARAAAIDTTPVPASPTRLADSVTWSVTYVADSPTCSAARCASGCPLNRPDPLLQLLVRASAATGAEHEPNGSTDYQ